MFSQYWETDQYFFSKVEKLVMHLMICLQEAEAYFKALYFCVINFWTYFKIHSFWRVLDLAER